MMPKVAHLARNFSTSLIRRNVPGGIPGINLPFNIDNKYKLTAYYILYFGSGMAVPFLILRHTLTK